MKPPSDGYGAPPGHSPPPGYGHPVQQGQPVRPGYPAPEPAVQGYPTQGYAPHPGYRPPPPAVGPAGQPLADFGHRLAAYLIDLVILTGIALLVAVPVFVVFFTRSDFSAWTDPYAPAPDPALFFSDFLVPLLLLEAGIFILYLAMNYVYHVEMMFRSGQTVGKKVMKLRVVPLDPAAALTRVAAAKRYFVAFVAAVFVPILPYLDGLWQLWDKPFQQCLHDKAADTIVIKVPS